jgi:hypothetical protein
VPSSHKGSPNASGRSVTSQGDRPEVLVVTVTLPPDERLRVHIADCLSGWRDSARGCDPALRTLGSVFSTMLTKRRAVDHCRVRSSLCRRS